MVTFIMDNGIVQKQDGTLVGRVENNEICDELGEAFLKIEGNEIKNNYGSTIAKVEKGVILSASGGPLGKVSDARRCFENCNSMSDVEVAGAWLPFVKGIK
ncbi:MAG: hypothetical protein WCT31_02155 [Candidatus Micrarchaeia archaeon]